MSKSILVVFRPDYPMDKRYVHEVTEKQTFKEAVAAAEKAMEISLKGYSYCVVAYHTLPRAVEVKEDSAMSDLKLKDKDTLVCLAPAHIKPLIKRVVKEKEEKKKVSVDHYKGYSIENVLTKLATAIEKKDTKASKIAHEYIEMFAADVFKTDEWLTLSYDTVLEILKGDGISATETEVMDAAVAWAKAQNKKNKVDDSTENVKKTMKDIFYCIRFPLMGLQEMAMIKILEQSQQLALFTYAGQKSNGDKNVTLDDSLKGFNAKARKPRPPIGPVVSGNYYTIKVKHSNMNIDITSSSTSDGALAWQYGENFTNAQVFQVTHVGKGCYKIEAKCSTKALTVVSGSTSTGARIEQRTYDNKKYQQFSFKKAETDSNGIDWYIVKPSHCDKVLDVESGSYSQSAYFCISDESKEPRQLFRFDAFGNTSS